MECVRGGFSSASANYNLHISFRFPQLTPISCLSRKTFSWLSSFPNTTSSLLKLMFLKSDKRFCTAGQNPEHNCLFMKYSGWDSCFLLHHKWPTLCVRSSSLWRSSEFMQFEFLFPWSENGELLGFLLFLVFCNHFPSFHGATDSDRRSNSSPSSATSRVPRSSSRLEQLD